MNKFELPKMVGPKTREQDPDPFKSDLETLRKSMDFASAFAKDISLQASELEQHLKKMHGNPNAINQSTFLVSELERKIQALREFLVVL
jgi:hypothetical protein